MSEKGKEREEPQPYTPREIVAELDKYVIGQKNAKRSVAVALRNRWRRQRVEKDLRDEIAPKNIIMIGPTGVGKTEIARRLSKLAQSPFLKIEASKFTEVGYVGRDVESMVRDLTELAVNMVRAEEMEKVMVKAREMAEERMLDLLLPPPRRGSPEPAPKETSPEAAEAGASPELALANSAKSSPTRERLRKMLREGKLDNRMVDLELTQRQIPVGDLLQRGNGGYRFQPEGDVQQPPAQEDQAEKGESSGGAGIARRRRVPETRGYGPGEQPGRRESGTGGDHLSG